MSETQVGISVVIPTHAGRPSVLTTVSALLESQDPHLEVIVVCDGDAAASRDVLSGVNDPRLIIVEQPHSGAQKARNRGLQRASQDWVSFVDDDDVPRPNWTEAWRACLNETSIAATGRLALWRDGAVESIKRCRLSLSDPTMSASTLMAGAFLVRRDILEAVGGYDQRVPAGQNQDLGLRILEYIRAHGVAGTIAETQDIVIDVYAQEAKSRLERYGSRHAAAAMYFMERFPERVAADPGASQAYSRILSRDARRRGDITLALRHASVAFRNDPCNIENCRSLTAAAYAALVAALARTRPARLAGAQRPQPVGAPLPPGARARLWGIAVTYNRPEVISSTLASYAEQTQTVDELVLVDNGSDPRVADLAHSVGALYVDVRHNSGPAGGIATGMEFVLASASDQDWVLLIDDDDPPPSSTSVEDLRRFAEEMLKSDPMTGGVGLVGAKYDRKSGRMIRVEDSELVGPVSVDYLGGGHLPLYRCGVLREIGVFDRTLFFGFDDAEFGLRLRSRGYRLYVDGSTWLDGRRAKGRLQLPRSALRTSPETASWRRYYSLRNSILLAKTYGTPTAPLVVAARGGAHALLDVARRRRSVPEVVIALRAIKHGLTGRAGRVIDPGDAAKTKPW